MYAEVIPCLRLPAEFDVFDYLISDEFRDIIFPGSLVKIPYRGRIVNGLVYRIKDESDYAEKILAIKSVIFNIPLFDKDYLEMINYVSEYYFVSKTSVFKALMPAIPKKIAPIEPAVKVTHGRQADAAHQSIVDFSDSRLLVYQDKDELLNQIAAFINNQQKNRQYILLLPQIDGLLKASRLLKNFPDIKLSVLHSNLNKTKYWQNWRDFTTGQSQVLIATRIGILTPSKNLHGIFVLDEESSDYKQYDQNPRYDARHVAEWLSVKKNIPVIFASQSPTLNRWNWANKNHWQIITLPQNSPRLIRFVDIEQERRKKNFSLVSDELKDACFESLQNGKKVLMFLNRKGYATMISCRDCGHTYFCKECGIPLIAHKNYTACHHCGYRGEMPLTCEKCRGTNIRISGAGLEKLEQQLMEMFKEYSILRLDKDIAGNKTFNLDDFKLIVGTNYLVRDYEEKLVPDLNVGVIGVINADNLFNFADYRTSERVWQELRKIINLATKTRANLYIQTFRPENQILKDLDNMNRFYSKELISRKMFAMPPIIKLIKIVVFDKNSSEAVSRANFLSQSFNVGKDGAVAEVLGPYPLYPEKIRGYFRQALLLKIKHDKPLDFLKNICHDSIIIDVDPEFVLT